MAARWTDHILGPAAEVDRPDPADAPVGALFQNDDTGDLEINDPVDGWVVYRPAVATGLSDPTTTKGDLLVRGAASVGRFAAGADGTVVMYDAAQTAGVKAKALDDSDVAAVAPNDQTGTTYTFVLADKHRLVTVSNAGAITVTIPPNSSVAFPLGTMLQVYQKGAGQITIAAGAGVTIRTPHGAKTSVQYALVTLVQVVADTWAVTGDTTT